MIKCEGWISRLLPKGKRRAIARRFQVQEQNIMSHNPTAPSKERLCPCLCWPANDHIFLFLAKSTEFAVSFLSKLRKGIRSQTAYLIKDQPHLTTSITTLLDSSWKNWSKKRKHQIFATMNNIPAFIFVFHAIGGGEKRTSSRPSPSSSSTSKQDFRTPAKLQRWASDGSSSSTSKIVPPSPPPRKRSSTTERSQDVVTYLSAPRLDVRSVPPRLPRRLSSSDL